MHLRTGMYIHADRGRRSRRVRTLVNRLEQHLRLQRELLWHPRLGLAGGRSTVPVRIPPDARRSSYRR
jgi:hypothetical protein